MQLSVCLVALYLHTHINSVLLTNSSASTELWCPASLPLALLMHPAYCNFLLKGVDRFLSWPYIMDLSPDDCATVVTVPTMESLPHSSCHWVIFDTWDVKNGETLLFFFLVIGSSGRQCGNVVTLLKLEAAAEYPVTVGHDQPVQSIKWRYRYT